MFARVSTSTATALLITLSLIWLMQALVHLKPSAPVVKESKFSVDWITLKREETPLVTQPEKMQWDPREKAHVPPARPRSRSDWSGISVSSTVSPPVANNHSSTFLRSVDGPLVSIMKVQPAYPPSMLARGLEGYVIVDFDVLETGRVANVRIVESSHSGFEKSAIKAAERFRFKPRIVSGVPQSSMAIRNLFRFQMEQ